MLRALFVRHGETDWNSQGRVQGRTDIPLNARGMAQAELIAGRLAAEPQLSALYTSPLRRAAATADIICARLGLEPIMDARLVERDMGKLEGLTGQDIEQRYPAFHAQWHSGERRVPFPDEEPREAFHGRISGFLADLTGRNGGTVVVITHGGAMGMIMAAVMRLDLERRFPFWFDNASLSVVEFGGPVPRVLMLNDTCHLRGQLPRADEMSEFLQDTKTDDRGPAGA